MFLRANAGPSEIISATKRDRVYSRKIKGPVISFPKLLITKKLEKSVKSNPKQPSINIA